VKPSAQIYWMCFRDKTLCRQFCHRPCTSAAFTVKVTV